MNCRGVECEPAFQIEREILVRLLTESASKSAGEHFFCGLLCYIAGHFHALGYLSLQYQKICTMMKPKEYDLERGELTPLLRSPNRLNADAGPLEDMKSDSLKEKTVNGIAGAGCEIVGCTLL